MCDPHTTAPGWDCDGWPAAPSAGRRGRVIDARGKPLQPASIDSHPHVLAMTGFWVVRWRPVHYVVCKREFQGREGERPHEPKLLGKWLRIRARGDARPPDPG